MQPSIFNHGALFRAGPMTTRTLCGWFSSQRYDCCLQAVFLFTKRPPAWMVALVPLSNLQETRAAVMALRAFNVETALVADSVKEAALAQIRMQWWRDAVDSLYGPKPQPHPVIQALKQARRLTRLSLLRAPLCLLDRRTAREGRQAKLSQVPACKPEQSSPLGQAILLPGTMQAALLQGNGSSRCTDIKRCFCNLASRWWVTCQRRATDCSALSRRERRMCVIASRRPQWQAWRRTARTRLRRCCTCRRAGDAGCPALHRLGHSCQL